MTIKKQGFMSLANFNIAEGFSEELAGLDSGFERIKIPAGGGTMFEVPGNNPNEPETVKEFSAVILHHHPMYTFYRDQYTGNSNPPNCLSFDGVNGHGEPGGFCQSCPNNRFGSGGNGSKACKNKHQMYLLRENEVFPFTLFLPTSSNKEFSRYIRILLCSGKKSDSVVTKFSLKKAVNKGGIAYSQVQFEIDRTLSKEELLVIKKFSEQIKAYFQNFQKGINIDENIGEITVFVE